MIRTWSAEPDGMDGMDGAFPGHDPAPPMSAAELAAGALAAAADAAAKAAVVRLGALAGLRVENGGSGDVLLALPGRGARYLRLAHDSADLAALLAAPSGERAARARALIARKGTIPSPWDY